MRCFEPKLALTAPDNGLQLIFKTIDELADHLHPGGGAIFELSSQQADAAAERLSDAGFQSSILLDLAGKKRFVTGTMPR